MVEFTNAEAIDEETQQQDVDSTRTLQLKELEEVAGTPAGASFLALLIEKTGVYSQLLDSEEQIYFCEGRRSIGLWLLSELNEANSALLAKIQNEYFNKKKEEMTNG